MKHMKTKLMHQLSSFLLILSMITAMNPNQGWSQNNPNHKTWEQEYNQLDNLVTTSSTPKQQIQRQVTIANFFALGGLLATVTCSNLSVMDVNVWAGGSIYFFTHSLILKAKEKKLAEKINKIRQTTGGWSSFEEGSAASTTVNKQKLEREDQVATMELILQTQREAIDLIKKKNNLLRNMIFIYGASATILGINMIKSWETGGNDNTTLCRPGVKQNAVEKVLVKIRDEITKGFSIMSLLPAALGTLKKTSSLQESNLSEKIVSEYKNNATLIEKLINKMSSMGHFVSNLLIADSLAIPSPLMITAFIEAALKQGETLLGNSIFHPYSRIALYAVMGVWNGVAVSRNNKDIGAYKEKINYFEKDLMALKSDTARHLSLEDKSTVETTNNNLISSKTTNNTTNNLLGCIKLVNDLPTHDPTCECTKNNSCMSFGNKISKNVPNKYKEVVKEVDAYFAGNNAWINDDKKSEEIIAKSTAASEHALDDVNLQLSKQNKNIDLKANVKNMLKSLANETPSSKLALASAGGTVSSNNSSNSSGIGDYNFGMDDNSMVKNKQGGVFVKEEMSVVDIPLNDIHSAPEDSVFDVVSLRYKKTAYPRMLNLSTAR